MGYASYLEDIRDLQTQILDEVIQATNDPQKTRKDIERLINALIDKLIELESKIPKDLAEALQKIAVLENERNYAIRQSRKYHEVMRHLEDKSKNDDVEYQSIILKNSFLSDKIDQLNNEISILQNDQKMLKDNLDSKNKKIRELQKAINLYNILNKEDDLDWIDE